MYQSTDVAHTYTMLSYLVAIAAIFGFCIIPRAKFVQTMTLNIIFISLGTAVSLIELWSSVKAREHTTPHWNTSHAFPIQLLAISRSSRMALLPDLACQHSEGKIPTVYFSYSPVQSAYNLSSPGKRRE